MSQIHCHFCGGIIQDVAAIEYRPPRFSAQFAMPHTAPCTCSPPVVYEHPPVLGGPEEGSDARRRGGLKATRRPPDSGLAPCRCWCPAV